MSTPVTSTNYDEALRARLVAVLRARQWIRTQPVGDAMGSLAKETFLPGADLTLVYSVDDTVPVKRNANDHTISSASAPWLVAYMLEEARQQTTVSLATLSGLHAADTAARVRHATERILMTDGQSALGVDVVVTAILWGSRQRFTGWGRFPRADDCPCAGGVPARHRAGTPTLAQ